MESTKTGKRGGHIPYRVCNETFQKVQQTFLTLRNSEPIGCSNIYFEPGEQRGMRLTTTGIEFCVDVERTTNRALEGETALKQTWARMLLGLDVDRQLANIVIQRCGEQYVRLGLSPTQYFRRNKYPERNAA